MPNQQFQSPPEKTELPLDNIDALVGGHIERGKAKVANAVTVMLISGVLLAPVMFATAVYIIPSAISDLKSFFEAWLTVLGPIVGTAIGFYFGESRAQQNSASSVGRRRT